MTYPYRIETSPLICMANPWTGFYMMGTSIIKELKRRKCLITSGKRKIRFLFPITCPKNKFQNVMQNYFTRSKMNNLHAANGQKTEPSDDSKDEGG